MRDEVVFFIPDYYFIHVCIDCTWPAAYVCNQHYPSMLRQRLTVNDSD